MKTNTIWRNDNYCEWEDYAKTSGDYEDAEINYETYYNECDVFFEDEQMNLDEEIDGYIVCFASLGLWDGRVNGAKEIGRNVHNILTSMKGDYLHFYCDRYNVRCYATHHDGRNYCLFRVVDTLEKAQKLVIDIAYHNMTEEQFRKKTKSLRPYIAKVYGW